RGRNWRGRNRLGVRRRGAPGSRRDFRDVHGMRLRSASNTGFVYESDVRKAYLRLCDEGQRGSTKAREQNLGYLTMRAHGSFLKAISPRASKGASAPTPPHLLASARRLFSSGYKRAMAASIEPRQCWKRCRKARDLCLCVGFPIL